MAHVNGQPVEVEDELRFETGLARHVGVAVDRPDRGNCRELVDDRAAADIPRVKDQLDPFERCYRLEQREILKRAVSSLPRRERLIISLYYERPRTMKEIAARLGLDQSRVSQLHSAALVRLRKRVSNLLRGPVPSFALNQDASTAHTL